MKLKNYRLIRLTLIGLGIFLGLLVWSGTNLSAQEKDKKGHLNRQVQIHIVSDKMEVNSRKNFIVFIGNVEANQGKMRLKANRLEIYTLKPNNTAPSESQPPKAERGKSIESWPSET